MEHPPVPSPSKYHVPETHIRMNTYKTNNTRRLLHTHYVPPLDLTAYIIQFIQNTERSVKLVPLMNFALFKPLAVFDIQLSSEFSDLIGKTFINKTKNVQMTKNNVKEFLLNRSDKKGT